MIQYHLDTQDGPQLAKDLDKISIVAVAHSSLVVSMELKWDKLIVEVNSIDFNTGTNKFEDNIENQYWTIRGLISEYGMEPNGVTPDLLVYMKEQIQVVTNDMNDLNDACLNTNIESDMVELDRKYQIEKTVLNLIYKLSKSNDYIQ